MNTTRPTINCPYCHGTGKFTLSSVYAVTHRLLTKHGPATGADLAKRDGCTAMAMNNRLAFLEKHGLAKSERDGRKRIYTAI